MAALQADLQRVEVEMHASASVSITTHHCQPFCAWRDKSGQLHIGTEHQVAADNVELVEFMPSQIACSSDAASDTNTVTAGALPLCWLSYGTALVMVDHSGTHLLRHELRVGSHLGEGVGLLEEDSVMRGFLQIKSSSLFSKTAYFTLEGGILTRYESERAVAGGPQIGQLDLRHSEVRRSMNGLSIVPRQAGLKAPSEAWDLFTDQRG